MNKPFIIIVLIAIFYGFAFAVVLSDKINTWPIEVRLGVWILGWIGWIYSSLTQFPKMKKIRQEYNRLKALNELITKPEDVQKN